VAVPGVLAGYLHVHDRLGTLALADVVAPAVALAAGGVEVTPMAASLVALLWPIFDRAPDMHSLFAPEGRRLEAGDRMVNPDLAAFLTRLGADPGHTFYRGELADAIAQDMAAGGGLITGEDLAAYRVVERAPLVVDYRGHRVLTNPAPSFGGSLVALTLRLLEESGPLPGRGSPGHAEALAEAMVETDRIRATGPVEPHLRTSRGTTHVSVADGRGNVASMTTSNGEASGHVVPGTGISLNNMLGEDDLHPDGFHAAPAGDRVSSMMSPTVVLGPDGAVRLVVGSGGSKRIRTTIVQVVSAVVDHGTDLADAVGDPRLHWDGDVLQVEPGWSADVSEALRRRWPVNLWAEQNLYFGGAHAVMPPPAADGAGDPRRGGAAIVVEP
jgi:gamma-glutamyltranspeptidase/glutathione hydrolase